MKIPKSVKKCLSKNMPLWTKKIKESKNIIGIVSSSFIKNDKISLGDYSSCIVGEFHGLKQQGSEKYSAYNGCGKCYEYSMLIFNSKNNIEFFKEIRKFCEHAMEVHGKRFKK